MNTGWIYLLIASCSETCWLYSLKFIDVKAVRAIGWNGFVHEPRLLTQLLPFLGYAVFGAANVIFLSMSMRHIPASTAYAVWMAVALAGTKLIDVLYFKEGISGVQLLWFACIIIGVIGLRSGG